MGKEGLHGGLVNAVTRISRRYAEDIQEGLGWGSPVAAKSWALGCREQCVPTREMLSDRCFTFKNSHQSEQVEGGEGRAAGHVI